MDTAPDTAQLVKDSYKEIVGIEPIEETNFAAIFGHLGEETVQWINNNSYLLISWLRRPVLRLLVERGLQSGHVCHQVRQGGRDEPQDWPRLQELDPQARQETRKYFRDHFSFSS